MKRSQNCTSSLQVLHCRRETRPTPHNLEINLETRKDKARALRCLKSGVPSEMPGRLDGEWQAEGGWASELQTDRSGKMQRRPGIGTRPYPCCTPMQGQCRNGSDRKLH